jgi:hypothetical protein
MIELMRGHAQKIIPLRQKQLANFLFPPITGRHVPAIRRYGHHIPQHTQ